MKHVRDRVARRIFDTEFVETDKQLADVLTKGLRVAQHARLTRQILHFPDPDDDTSTTS